MSALVAHAERELELAGVEPEVRASIIEAVRAFTEYYGHSVSSASLCRVILNELLQYKPLSPLTDNPSEWVDHSTMSGYPMFQNVRNGEAFSEDGGHTYYVLSEERRWIPWVLRRRLRKAHTYLVFPRHTSEVAE